MQSKTFSYKSSCSLDELLTIPLYIRHKNVSLKITAMFDTGAAVSVISPTLRDYLDIPTCCSTGIRGVHGVQTCDVIRADLSFDNEVWFLQRRLPVCDFSRAGVDILIGLDILKKGSFNLRTDDGKFDINFSIRLTEKE